MWIVCQIGAREHYAIPRALHQDGDLGALLTDFWIEPGSLLSQVPGGRRLKDRYHTDLGRAPVYAPNAKMFAFEATNRLTRRTGWDLTLDRNALFQREALTRLSSLATEQRSPITLFSYSYAARELFRFAKSCGWRTVLGQIDPGPEEERIVAAEHQRYLNLRSSWQPAPAAYWQSWREEVELADRIIVNSDWSRECLRKEGVPADKMEVIPLAYAGVLGAQLSAGRANGARNKGAPLKLLFLGQINLRKGVGRLLDAMRLLRDKPVELTLAGPAEIDPSAWADLPNVRWIGAVPRSQVGDVYQSADALILPTLSDGYALTQREALSYGLPVIASRHCGEVVANGRNGWVLEDLEPQNISKLILHSATTPLVEIWSGAGFALCDLRARLTASLVPPGAIPMSSE